MKKKVYQKIKIAILIRKWWNIEFCEKLLKKFEIFKNFFVTKLFKTEKIIMESDATYVYHISFKTKINKKFIGFLQFLLTPFKNGN